MLLKMCKILENRLYAGTWTWQVGDGENEKRRLRFVDKVSLWKLSKTLDEFKIFKMLPGFDGKSIIASVYHK